MSEGLVGLNKAFSTEWIQQLDNANRAPADGNGESEQRPCEMADALVEFGVMVGVLAGLPNVNGLTAADHGAGHAMLQADGASRQFRRFWSTHADESKVFGLGKQYRPALCRDVGHQRVQGEIAGREGARR